MENNSSFIGDIKQSLLEPNQFLPQHPGWVLLAGQKLAQADQLALLGFNQLPDARGIFLRGMNQDRDAGQGDTDGDRPIGSYQPDELKSHSHQARMKFHAALNFDAGDFPPGAQSFDGTRIVAGGSTENSGGPETRPRNISVYIYIKIN